MRYMTTEALAWQREELFARIAAWLGILVLLIGVLGLLGYAFNLPVLLTYGYERQVQLALPTSVAMVLMGISVIVALGGQSMGLPEPWRKRLGYLAAGVTALIGLVYFGRYLVVADFDFYRVLTTDFGQFSMAFLAALSMLVLGVALLVCLRWKHHEPALVFGVGMPAVMVFNFALFAMLGHWQHIPVLYNFRMSFPSAVGFSLVAIALCVGTIPFRGLFLPMLSPNGRARALAWLGLGVGFLIIVKGFLDVGQLNTLAPATSPLMERYFLNTVLTTMALALTVKVLALRAVHFYNQADQAARMQSRTAERESILRKVVQSIHSSLDLEESFRNIVNDLGSCLETDRCFISRYDWRKGLLSPPSREYRSSEEIRSVITASPALWRSLADFAHALCRSGGTVAFCGDSGNLSAEAREQLGEISVQSGLACAVSYRGGCQAVLFVHQVNHKRQWTDEEMEIIKTVANQTAIAIRQAEQYQREQETSEILRRNVISQEAVADIGRTAMSDISMEKLFAKACRTVSDNLEVPFVKILESDIQDAGKLKVRSVLGFSPTLLGQEMGPGMEPQSFYTLSAMGPVVVEDIHREARFGPSRLHAEYGLLSGVSVVIYSDSKAYGVLEADCRENRSFNRNEVLFLQSVANILGMALERRCVELEVRGYIDKLQASNQALEEFATIASHDLQSPLRKIQTFIELLKRQTADRLSSDEKDFLDRMQWSANRMQNLISDLLALARVSRTERPFEPVNLNKILSDVRHDMEEEIHFYQGTVEIGDLGTIEADPTQMYQLFKNLVENGLKYARPGVTPEVRVTAEFREDSRVRLSVSDNGIGFEPAKAESIFGLFTRLHGKSKYEGTGIGLAICKKIVNRHSGRIWAESTPGAGSVFYVELPRKQGERDPFLPDWELAGTLEKP